MVTEIKIDPVTRIEGHLGITVQVENGKVIDAQSNCTMFRGFETILLGRDPRDAPVLAQRICGVCHETHRITGVRALENAAGISVTDGARKIRNLIEAVTTLYSHALWFYALGGPDYSDAVTGNGLKRLDPITGQGYKEAVANQRKLHEVLSILGGKVPHHMTDIHGGITHQPSAEKISQMKTRILDVSVWMGATANLPAVLGDKLAGRPNDYSKGYVLNDVVDWAVYAKSVGADTWGIGYQKYIAFGAYDMPDGSLFEPRGVWDGIKVIPMDESKVTEHVKYSWYTDDSGGVPRNAPTLKVNTDKPGAYSWAKSPRYGTMAVEGGPLARMVIAGFDPADLRKNLGGGVAKASTFNRSIARMQEALILRDKILEWLDGLVPGEKTYTSFTVPTDAFGVGLWEAPRGAVGHWVEIKTSKISRYQIISGTTWNASPRDDSGQRGAIEEALIGVPVPDVTKPVNVVRTIRSFDPCLACTVHVMTPHGKKYSIQVT